MFRVGQKVVCVNAGGNGPLQLAYGGANGVLAEGAVYTVSVTVPYTQCIRLCGVKGGWCVTRFRPLVSRKTSISIFEALLTPAGQKEPANG